MNNLYWSIFKNIEREVINLSNEIHFDDDQLKIYSIKITELLIRTVVEVESISKELYFANDGIKPDDNDLYFDTDCMNLLESKWLLSKKKVLVSSPNFYFKLEENQILTPLKKANKRGTSSSDWLKAYQAIKHNRAKNLEKGNLKHLIRALAGLYVLNLFYRGTTYELEKDGTGTNFNINVGSKIFSIKIHPNQSVSEKNVYQKKPDFDECIYLIVPTEKTKKVLQESLKITSKKAQETYKANVGNEIIKKLSQTGITHKTDLNDKLQEIKEIARKFQSNNAIKTSKENGQMLHKAILGLEYQAILNKQQF